MNDSTPDLMQQDAKRMELAMAHLHDLEASMLNPCQDAYDDMVHKAFHEHLAASPMPNDPPTATTDDGLSNMWDDQLFEQTSQYIDDLAQDAIQDKDQNKPASFPEASSKAIVSGLEVKEPMQGPQSGMEALQALGVPTAKGLHDRFEPRHNHVEERRDKDSTSPHSTHSLMQKSLDKEKPQPVDRFAILESPGSNVEHENLWSGLDITEQDITKAMDSFEEVDNLPFPNFISGHESQKTTSPAPAPACQDVLAVSQESEIPLIDSLHKRSTSSISPPSLYSSPGQESNSSRAVSLQELQTPSMERPSRPSTHLTPQLLLQHKEFLAENMLSPAMMPTNLLACGSPSQIQLNHAMAPPQQMLHGDQHHDPSARYSQRDDTLIGPENELLHGITYQQCLGMPPNAVTMQQSNHMSGMHSEAARFQQTVPDHTIAPHPNHAHFSPGDAIVNHQIMSQPIPYAATPSLEHQYRPQQIYSPQQISPSPQTCFSQQIQNQHNYPQQPLTIEQSVPRRSNSQDPGQQQMSWPEWNHLQQVISALQRPPKRMISSTQSTNWPQQQHAQQNFSSQLQPPYLQRSNSQQSYSSQQKMINPHGNHLMQGHPHQNFSPHQQMAFQRQNCAQQKFSLHEQTDYHQQAHPQWSHAQAGRPQQTFFPQQPLSPQVFPAQQTSSPQQTFSPWQGHPNDTARLSQIHAQRISPSQTRLEQTLSPHLPPKLSHQQAALAKEIANQRRVAHEISKLQHARKSLQHPSPLVSESQISPCKRQQGIPLPAHHQSSAIQQRNVQPVTIDLISPVEESFDHLPQGATVANQQTIPTSLTQTGDARQSNSMGLAHTGDGRQSNRMDLRRPPGDQRSVMSLTQPLDHHRFMPSDRAVNVKSAQKDTNLHQKPESAALSPPHGVRDVPKHGHIPASNSDVYRSIQEYRRQSMNNRAKTTAKKISTPHVEIPKVAEPSKQTKLQRGNDGAESKVIAPLAVNKKRAISEVELAEDAEPSKQARRQTPQHAQAKSAMAQPGTSKKRGIVHVETPENAGPSKQARTQAPEQSRPPIMKSKVAPVQAPNAKSTSAVNVPTPATTPTCPRPYVTKHPNNPSMQRLEAIVEEKRASAMERGEEWAFTSGNPAWAKPHWHFGPDCRTCSGCRNLNIPHLGVLQRIHDRFRGNG